MRRYRSDAGRWRVAWRARRRGGCAVLLAVVLGGGATSGLGGCATSPGRSDGADGSAVIRVVAAENFWGSLAAQLGGSHVRVSSVIDNPDADPHDYEPTAADARAVAGSRLAIINGVGYDAWAGKLVDANPAPGRAVLNVGELVGVESGGNPHLWYSPPTVRRVIDRISAEYTTLAPADAGYFNSRHDMVLNTDLKPYFDLVDEIKAAYRGTPVGASESIVSPLAEATGLDLITPASFLSAVSEGADPTAADKATIDRQIATRQIKVYVYNSQNATPDVHAQVDAAKRAGILVTTVTESLTPTGASFQDWQVGQLTALRSALAKATGE